MVDHAREHTDPKLYHREWGHFNMDQLRTYEVELWAEAVRIGRWLRNIAGTGHGLTTQNDDVALNWPRVPICRQPGGYCSFIGPCLEDSDQARSSFDQRQQIRWLTTAASKAVISQWETP